MCRDGGRGQEGVGRLRGWGKKGREEEEEERLEWETECPGFAKSLSYMENTSRLQGNQTTSEFQQTKITPNDGAEALTFFCSFLFFGGIFLNGHSLPRPVCQPEFPRVRRARAGTQTVCEDC